MLSENEVEVKLQLYGITLFFNVEFFKSKMFFIHQPDPPDFLVFKTLCEPKLHG
ncbi:MAG: hypothetical protein FD155_2389 [Bacteroidetes bacterium]|nr:MAG: hypothetical protein FD155_2389 [Bacteroidota bacterium]